MNEQTFGAAVNAWEPRCPSRLHTHMHDGRAYFGGRAMADESAEIALRQSDDATIRIEHDKMRRKLDALDDSVMEAARALANEIDKEPADQDSIMRCTAVVAARVRIRDEYANRPVNYYRQAAR